MSRLFCLAPFLWIPGCGLLHSGGVGSTGSGAGTCDGESMLYTSAVDVGELVPRGCHYLITAADAEETVRLIVDSVAFADVASEGSASAVYTLPDAGVRLEVEVGCQLNGEYCTDDVSATPGVFGVYEATAGTLTVSATRDEESYTEEGGYDAYATVTLEGVTLEDDDGNVVTIDALTWEEVRLYTPMLG
ncbi:MAG: hypothetical protein Q8P18_04840 [Pseudomonadota bacterium]|nr:hypothetical protein [Pseudomonadota bacterium]